MASNPWDNSSIILSNQAGANWGRGIEQVGQAFSKGVQGYFERKQQKEKEEATVDWINQNEQATNALFPQLASVKDPAERRKVIKAGIKGAGLENLVQVQGFMENQRRAKALEGVQQEMAKAQLAGVKLHNQGTEQMMSEHAAEGRALQFAGSPTAALHEQIMRGVPAAQLDPNAEVDRAGVYMEMGGRSPQMIQALTKARPFSPAEFMTPSGLNMVQTSPNSFIPDPRVRQKPGKADAFPGGPEYSKDKKFYRSGPDDAWKPAKASGGKLDPVQAAELNALPTEIADLEQKITDAAGEVRKGNKKPGPDWLPGADSYDEKITKMRADLDAKKKRLRELNQLTSGNDSSEDAPGGAPAAKVVADPFAYVLGN